MNLICLFSKGVFARRCGLNHRPCGPLGLCQGGAMHILSMAVGGYLSHLRALHPLPCSSGCPSLPLPPFITILLHPSPCIIFPACLCISPFPWVAATPCTLLLSMPLHPLHVQEPWVHHYVPKKSGLQLLSRVGLSLACARVPGHPWSKLCKVLFLQLVSEEFYQRCCFDWVQSLAAHFVTSLLQTPTLHKIQRKLSNRLRKKHLCETAALSIGACSPGEGEPAPPCHRPRERTESTNPRP